MQYANFDLSRDTAFSVRLLSSFGELPLFSQVSLFSVCFLNNDLAGSGLHYFFAGPIKSLLSGANDTQIIHERTLGGSLGGP